MSKFDLVEAVNTALDNAQDNGDNPRGAYEEFGAGHVADDLKERDADISEWFYRIRNKNVAQALLRVAIRNWVERVPHGQSN